MTSAVTNPTFSVIGLYKDMTLTPEGKIATIKIAQTVSGSVQEAVYNVAPTVSITGGSLPATDRTLELKGSNALVTEIKIY
ncbi:hypothetical protein D3C76_1771760 [compost metagenome]